MLGEGYPGIAHDMEMLRAENARLREVVQTALASYALQAQRDCADPGMLKGWRRLQDEARAALTGA